MRIGNYIVTHEDFQGQEKADGSMVEYPYERFIVGHAIAKGHASPLDSTHIRGTVRAYINEGRWIVECPSECGGAVIPSLKLRAFMCPNCANLENDGMWYRAIFPPDYRQIENALLRRPNRRGPMFPHEARNRNWIPGETLEDLQRENQEHGIV